MARGRAVLPEQLHRRGCGHRGGHWDPSSASGSTLGGGGGPKGSLRALQPGGAAAAPHGPDAEPAWSAPRTFACKNERKAGHGPDPAA